MPLKLKSLRSAAGLTQAKLAAEIGVTQPNYQRWESGMVPIPKSKLEKLAEVLKVAPDFILGRHPPVEIISNCDPMFDGLRDYGTVAIEFCGPGEPLVLSISKRAFSLLHRDLQGESEFFTIESQDNQTVLVRTRAVADIQFTSEYYARTEPEAAQLGRQFNFKIAELSDWAIVARIAYGDMDIEDFDADDVERVRNMVTVSDQRYDELIANGRLKKKDLENERKKDKARTHRIFELATNTTYQFSNGVRRSILVNVAEDLYKAFHTSLDPDYEPSDNLMLRIKVEDYNKITFINKNALDYVSIPTHRFEDGSIDFHEVDAKE